MGFWNNIKNGITNTVKEYSVVVTKDFWIKDSVSAAKQIGQNYVEIAEDLHLKKKKK
jgi:hypothetical protein